MTNLRKSSKVTVPTDKANSFQTIELSQYIDWVEKHLNDSSTESLRNKLVEVNKKAVDLLDKVGDIPDDKEYNFIKESFNSRAVPTLRLLIKDNKKPNRKGYYATHLIAPATNFTTVFRRLDILE